MVELLSQGMIALSTWAWLEVHSTSFAMMVAALLALAVVAIVAAAMLTVVLRLWAAALPAGRRERAFPANAARPPTLHRPVGGRGPRAPGAAFRRLALV
ncbi:hypothetical protein ET475_09005 [Microbacterium protaetiae]|uniref:Uncharacterized protein n=1 Tax=Microbacterium protaetiae TaxID=2509458 RepID=A0A4P6EDC3_9MICO|nr:hypothetical protein [Microbacterium protaetiae]QAY60114.1 hypothetical protein ET475_09005 [Microbacterium protaetiae]